jgi:uncharacterized hydrophobic protein (TIGR00271 family)
MSPRSPGTLVALLGPDLAVASQLRWAVRLATARKLDLLVLQRLESPDERVVEVPLDEPPEGEGADAVREVARIVADSPGLRPGPRDRPGGAGEADGEEQPRLVTVRLKHLYFASLSSLRRAILAETGKGEVQLFTIAREQLLDMADVDLVHERRLFLRYIPCETVLCHGLTSEQALGRVLAVAGPGPHARAALQLGLDLATQEDGTLTAVQVNPAVGVDAERVGQRRLDRFLASSPAAEHPAVSRRVVVDDQPHQGIRRVWEEGRHDLVVVGAERSEIERSVAPKLGKGIPIAVVTVGSPIANRFRQFVEDGIERLVPQIAREDRVSLVDRVQSSAAWNFDFVALMVLSTTMAAIGLIQDSAAVVIGAMLVAPLMTPLLGMGLALVQGNPVLARLSFRSLGLGLCVSLLGGVVVGLATPSLEEPTRQMLARGGPGLLDLWVAFAAGLAAAYASSRPGLIAALPGVAIAAALVPPIATSGLALSLGDLPLAMGALLLFGINMVTIVLASMLSLWAVGLRHVRKTSLWREIVGNGVILMVLGLGVYLSVQPKAHELTEELPAGLVEAVQESLGEGYRLDGLAVAYDELGIQLNVSAVGAAPPTEELATAVRSVASDLYAGPVRVRLLTRIAIDTEPVQ